MSRHVNELINATVYNSIRYNMVSISRHYMGAAIAIQDQDSPISFYGDPDRDASFTRQMGQVLLETSSIHPAIKKPPEAIVLTANSAIPVADAVRGFYDTMGIAIPNLTHIRADQSCAKTYYTEAGDANYVNYSLRKDYTDAENEEIKRLQTVLDGADHVSVIDQYVASGQTITYAAQLLSAAGVKQVTAIRGKWYEQIPAKDVNLAELTSRHAEFMQSIGSQAAQTATTYYKHFANKELVTADGQAI